MFLHGYLKELVVEDKILTVIQAGFIIIRKMCNRLHGKYFISDCIPFYVFTSLNLGSIL